ncbi:MAG: hypothetical protein VZT48_13700 [Bulleidia sp.]|nr:hypothetical protein [Bulleidia sp.]
MQLKSSAVVCLLSLVLPAAAGMLSRNTYQYTDSEEMFADYSVNLDPESAVFDYASDSGKYQQLFEEGTVLSVVPVEKNVNARGVVTTVQVNKVYKGDAKLEGKRIRIVESYEMVYYTDGTTAQNSLGLNLPMRKDRNYLVSLHHETGDLYTLQTNSYSCYEITDSCDVYTTKGLDEIDDNACHIIQLEGTFISQQTAELNGLGDISQLVSDMNQTQDMILERIRNLN